MLGIGEAMGIKSRPSPGISWSDMRKTLERENICSSLKGRIQYFQTRYRGAHDQHSRIAFRFDEKKFLRLHTTLRMTIHMKYGTRLHFMIHSTSIITTLLKKALNLLTNWCDSLQLWIRELEKGGYLDFSLKLRNNQNGCRFFSNYG